VHTSIIRHLAVSFGAASLAGLSAHGSEASTDVEPDIARPTAPTELHPAAIGAYASV